jgi:IclR family KDG regulon transcriptional repressor
MATDTQNTSKVLQKALLVLETLARRGGESGVSELAREVALDKSTVYRLLNTLVDSGYLARDHTGRYRLTVRLSELAKAAPAAPSLLELALPQLRRLAKATSETAYIAVVHDDMAIFLDKIEGNQTIRVHTPNGSRIPLHCGSAAKVLLAYQSPELIARVSDKLKQMTDYSITNSIALQKELVSIRKRGFAIGQQEWRLGVSGVAAPARDATGAVVAGLALSGPSDRLGKSRLLELAPAVVEAAQRLSATLGWRA